MLKIARCKGITKEGERCKNPVSGGEYCHHHPLKKSNEKKIVPLLILVLALFVIASYSLSTSEYPESNSYWFQIDSHPSESLKDIGRISITYDYADEEGRIFYSWEPGENNKGIRITLPENLKRGEVQFCYSNDGLECTNELILESQTDEDNNVVVFTLPDDKTFTGEERIITNLSFKGKIEPKGNFVFHSITNSLSYFENITLNFEGFKDLTIVEISPKTDECRVDGEYIGNGFNVKVDGCNAYSISFNLEAKNKFVTDILQFLLPTFCISVSAGIVAYIIRLLF